LIYLFIYLFISDNLIDLRSVGEATTKQLEQKSKDYGQSQAKIDDLQMALDR
jgi:hypothetical protein